MTAFPVQRNWEALNALQADRHSQDTFRCCLDAEPHKKTSHDACHNENNKTASFLSFFCSFQFSKKLDDCAPPVYYLTGVTA
jgi:hypothetical protein